MGVVIEVGPRVYFIGNTTSKRNGGGGSELGELEGGLVSKGSQSLEGFELELVVGEDFVSKGFLLWCAVGDVLEDLP